MDEVDKTNCKVVYQGVPGAYSYIAMKRYFGENVENFHVPTWRDAMEAVKMGKADYAVLPIENSTAGIVAGVYDLLQEYNNYIIAETYIKVEHALLGLPGTDLDKVTTVYSHPQGLMQCEGFWNSTRTGIRLVRQIRRRAPRRCFWKRIRPMLPLQAKKRHRYTDWKC